MRCSFPGRQVESLSVQKGVFCYKNQTEKQNLLRLMDWNEINISKYEIKELCDKKLFFFESFVNGILQKNILQ